MIVFASILGAILATGLLALNPSTLTGNAEAQSYGYKDPYYSEYGYKDPYSYEDNYYKDDNRYGYDNKYPKKSSHVDIQKIKCVNSNINVNGIDITQIPQDNTAIAAANEGEDATGAQNGNGLADRINFERNLVNICINVNDNEQVKVTPPPEEEQTCEDCFSMLSDQERIQVIFFANNEFNVETIQSIEDLCNFLETSTLPKTELGTKMAIILESAGVSTQGIGFVLDCLENLELILGPT